MTTEDIRAELQQNIDENKFFPSLFLCLGIPFFFGGAGKKKKFKKNPQKNFIRLFAEADVSVYEELMIRGMIPGYAKLTIKQRKRGVRVFCTIY